MSKQISIKRGIRQGRAYCLYTSKQNNIPGLLDKQTTNDLEQDCFNALFAQLCYTDTYNSNNEQNKDIWHVDLQKNIKNSLNRPYNKDCLSTGKELLQTIKIRKTLYHGHLLRIKKYFLPQLVITGKIGSQRRIGKKKVS